MFAPILSVQSLLLAIFMLMGGSGFITSLVSLQLEEAGHRAPVIALITTAYFVGLTIGSLRILPIIQRVGHIRTFAACVSLMSASTLFYTLFESAPLWTVLRLIDGFCIAGVFICLESWLNERAQPATRGAVLGSYMVALYSGQSVGQFLLNLDASPALPFIAASLLISLSVLPIALTRLQGPALAQSPTLSPRGLYAASPLGLIGVGTTGLMIGAFYALGAVFARRMGVELAATALFMSIVIAGGVALQFPIGWLSDRIDRRRVIVGTLAGAAAVCMAIAALPGGGGALLFALGALFGGFAFALYPLCVAHTNDHLTAEQRVSASGGLVLVYSVGAAAGPIAGSTAMLLIGPGGLFAFIGSCALVALVFGLWRQRQRGAVPGELQQRYQLMPRTTPASAILDPLSPEE